MKQNDEANLDIALWRYGLISPLLHRDANDLTLKTCWRRHLHVGISTPTGPISF